jgi:hypothetical protein
MRIVFSLGLMMLDQMMMPVRPLPYDRLALITRLLPRLLGAVREMKQIDRTNAEYWDDAFRHLALRRMLYLSRGISAKENLPKIMLEPSVAPTISDFIEELDKNVEGLLAFIDVAIRNSAERTRLRDALTSAGVDLGELIRTADRIIEINPRRSGIDAGQLERTRSLLN